MDCITGHCELIGGKMAEVKDKKYQIRVTEAELNAWKEAALDQRYMTLSEFIRDAINEKIESWKELEE